MRRTRGMTIAELMVAMMLAGLLMLVIVSAMSVLSRSQAGLLARTEPRQQLRAFVYQLQSELRTASFLYPEGVYNIHGATVNIPGPGNPGDAVLFAVPENATPPITYRVCCAFTRPRSKPDPRNPNAREAVYFISEGVAAPLSNLPSEIDPNVLSATNAKVYDAYLDTTGMTSALTSTGFGVQLGFKFKRIPDKGDTVEQSLTTTVVLRNAI